MPQATELYGENSQGELESAGVTNKALHTTQDRWFPVGESLAPSQTILDLPDDTTALRSTNGIPTLANIKTVTFLPEENVYAVVLNFHLQGASASNMNCGVYVALNAASPVDELTRGGFRYWIPAGVPRLLKSTKPITSVSAVSMCDVAQNQLDVEPAS